MVDILLDTNVVIYFYGQHPTYLHYFRTIIGKTAGVSVVTYMETLVGASSDQEERGLRKLLDTFEIIPVDVDIANESALWMRRRKHKSLRHPRLADTIIGQTALSLGVPLATNNPKDFAVFSGLKLIVPE